MTKAAHFLTSLLFVIVCAAVWYIWKLGAGIMTELMPGRQHGEIMRTALAVYPWILALPVPSIIYSAVLMDRVELLPEKALLYFVFTAMVSTILILGTIILFGRETAALLEPLGAA